MNAASHIQFYKTLYSCIYNLTTRSQHMPRVSLITNAHRMSYHTAGLSMGTKTGQHCAKDHSGNEPRKPRRERGDSFVRSGVGEPLI